MDTTGTKHTNQISIKFITKLMENNSCSDNWILLGAEVKVVTHENGETREVYHTFPPQDVTKEELLMSILNMCVSNYHFTFDEEINYDDYI